MLPAKAETAPDDQEDEESGIVAANKPLTSRQAFFVRLVFEGKSRSEAYRVAYCKPDITAKDAANRAYIASCKTNVAQALKAQHYDQPYHRLLTKEDILRVCAGIVMSETATRHERLRAGQVYASIAGFIPREMQSLLSDDGQLNHGTLRMTVNIFQNAPSRIRKTAPLNVTPTEPATNGRH